MNFRKNKQNLLDIELVQTSNKFGIEPNWPFSSSEKVNRFVDDRLIDNSIKINVQVFEQGECGIKLVELIILLPVVSVFLQYLLVLIVMEGLRVIEDGPTEKSPVQQIEI